MSNDLLKLLLRILLISLFSRKIMVDSEFVKLMANATAVKQEAADLNHHYSLRPSGKFVFKEVVPKPLLYYFITDIQNNHVPEESNWNMVAGNNIVESKALKVENTENMHNVKKKKNILYLARVNINKEKKKI